MGKERTISIISKEFWPTSNGTVTCISNIINELKKEYNIDIFCSNPLKLRSEVIYQDNIRIFEYGSIFNIYYIYVEKIKNFDRAIIVSKFLNHISKILYYLFGIHSINTERNWRKVWRRIINVINNNNTEYILSISMPFSNASIASMIKRKNSKIQVGHIFFDLFADNPVLCDNDIKKNLYISRLYEENQWLTYSDKIFITKEMFYSYEKNHKHLLEKIQIIGLPMIYKINSHNNNIDNNKKDNRIIITYTGQFYLKIRNSFNLLKLIEKITTINDDLYFQIYGGSFDIDEKIIIERKKIIFYGNVSKNEVLVALNNADILINISNTSTTQIPSKIYEYISTGKPIINLYSIDNDLCKKILDSYPLSISIKYLELENDESIRKINTFIIQNRTKKVSFDIISKDYIENTPSYVTSIINKSFNQHKW